MRPSILVLALAVSAHADWSVYRAEPIEVFTDAKPQDARALLGHFDQLRWHLAKILGRTDLVPKWPVRLVVFKPAKDRAVHATPHLRLSRDAYVGGLPSGQPIPAAWMEDWARILLEDEARRLPPALERGLISLLGTMTAENAMMTLGSPPDASKRDLEWARVRLLTLDPEWAGRSRVFFSNLERDAPIDVAYRNAFEKTEKEMDVLVDAHLKSARFDPVRLSGKPLNFERDYRPRPIESFRGAIAMADLLQGEPARRAYIAILNDAQNPEALEGAEMYAEAIAADSKSAPAWVKHALLIKDDPAASRKALDRAIELNPRWAEPHRQYAKFLRDPTAQVAPLKKACELEPRDAKCWQRLAETQLEAKDFGGAAMSWREAERAAPNAEERARLNKLRMAYEQQRLDLIAAEKRRQQEEEERALQKLKDEAMARIREAEVRANSKLGGRDPNAKVVEWWDGPKADAALTGALERVDCLQSKLRLHVRGPAGLTALLVPDPGKIVLIGGGDASLGCGPQRPPKRLKVEYQKRPDAALKTAGDVLTLEFMN